ETFATTYLDQSPIYASSDGQKVAAGGAAVWDSDGEKFFAITLTRNTDLSDPDDDDKSGYLAFTIKLSWPAYTPDPDGQPTASSQQSVMVVPAAIPRYHTFNRMRPSSRKGFTIIELLVAVGVTALLVTLMINIVTTVLTNWNRTSGTLSSGNQARMILDQISQDLQGAILKTDGNVWIAASIQAGGGAAGMSKEAWFAGKPSTVSINPTSLDIEECSFGQAGVWLRFFPTPSDINQAGDLTTISAPRAVSYQMIRRQ